ncbi:bifunctional N-acetylglucosamine-1-phosphate uridyltransferase/glucosamine-1-phosphate acetyltransferase [Ventosimonas gracilis]|uniref:Bifunctional protein GlmU n=1 Tax=Ventosimonas gracilis TaxID=1680762 RepID=A0A139SW60_9GAMM|nr:bifunctional UDP-N-acetylglucosamine diphosphorylase/glucosamine-1-phosphate N-acetyltransferase GlmU [Ventosimonas gracilis]KXU38829.1 bifunctional N-acetylglucosamine-1-phosphate uridyltransferase/glucosamine-1-phosphate acetyltransferase [Ventosimonas gracilis]
MPLDIVILAAGQGTRMRSKRPKVLHPLAGKPMLSHVIDTARALNPKAIHLITGHAAEQVQLACAAKDLHFIVQPEQLGTGHAVMQALPFLSGEKTLVLYGDVPMIEVDTLQQLLSQVSDKQMALLTVELANPTGYGRIIRSETGQVKAIVEEKDASPAQKAIKEGNSGIIALPTAPLEDWLKRLSNDNVQGEYYLTDVIALAVADGAQIATVKAQEPMEVQGANDRIQLAELERHYQYRAARRLMKQGVTLADPARFDLRGTVEAGRDIYIDINVILEGHVVIEDEVEIGANCIIKDSLLRKGAKVFANSHLDGAELGENAGCGPFARLRPGSQLKARAHVGNFVELKNAVLGEDAKAGHLSYLGDADIGARSNIGAGTITCNYDGAHKHRTLMGENVFIGSNTALVAPVTLEKNASTAAGSVITQNVAESELAVARSRQRNIGGWKRPQK